MENLKLLLPMVIIAEEVEEALRLIRQASEELEEEGGVVAPPSGSQDPQVNSGQRA